MRAVVEENGEDRLPEVKVLITKGKEDLTIKVMYIHTTGAFHLQDCAYNPHFELCKLV